MVYRRKNEKEKSLFFLATRTPALQSTQDGLAPGEWETTPFRCDVRSLGRFTHILPRNPRPFYPQPLSPARMFQDGEDFGAGYRYPHAPGTGPARRRRPRMLTPCRSRVWSI